MRHLFLRVCLDIALPLLADFSQEINNRLPIPDPRDQVDKQGNIVREANS